MKNSIYGTSTNQPPIIYAQSGDPNDYAKLGSAFHHAIVRGCHNKILIETTDWLSLRVLPYRRFQVMTPGRLKKNQSDHDAIISAIVAGDAEGAETAYNATPWSKEMRSCGLSH